MPALPEEILVYFIEQDDFCHPEWASIFAKIMSDYSDEHKTDILRECALTWLDRIQKKLGAKYTVYETRHFFLIADPADKPMKDYFAFIERMRQTLHQTLADIVWKNGSGKHVILLFDEPDDYYRYLAPFYSDGEHPASGGVFLRGSGYRHIAIPYNQHSILETLAHEYTHNCVSHLPLPRWLNEALAMRFEGMLAGGPSLVIDYELCEKHQAHWNETTIQEFWQGTSWSHAGESFSLSYQLSRILLKKIEEDIRPSKARLLSFIGQAHRDDAGESAARQHLGISLGDLAADFLGDGNWSPHLVNSADKTS
jgi:hypothetical protein